jgi:transposase
MEDWPAAGLMDTEKRCLKKPEVGMGRRLFTREFKIEAVRLVQDRGVSVAQVSRDLDLHENMWRRWVTEFSGDPAQAFPGCGK